MSENKKNRLNIKEILATTALISTLGALALDNGNLKRVIGLGNHGDTTTHVEKTHDTGITGHSFDSANVVLPKTELSRHSDRYP